MSITIRQEISGGPSSIRLLAYGGLAAPLAIAELPILIYLPAFYAREVGLSIGVVGLVFLLARLWDGLTDPLIGWLSDHCKSRFGRRKPWVIAGAPLLMMATWFLCVPPEGVGVTYLAIWAGLFYLSYTLVIVPYWSWGAEITTVYEERNRVTGFREGFSMVGSLVVNAAILVLLPNDAPTGEVLFLISLMIVVLIPLTAFSAGGFVPDPRCRRRSVHKPMAGIKRAFKNKPFLCFVVVFLLYFVAVGATNSMAIFLVDGLGVANYLYLLLFVQYVIAISVAPFVVKLANRHNKHTVMVAGLLFVAVAYVIWGATPYGNLWMAFAGVCSLGMGFSCAYVLPTSILADIVDYDTVSSGEEVAGLYVAIFKFFQKLGLAGGVGIVYGFLEFVGFDPSAAVAGLGTHITILKVAACGIPALLVIPAAFILYRFPITKTVHRQLREKINTNQVAMAAHSQ